MHARGVCGLGLTGLMILGLATSTQVAGPVAVADPGEQRSVAARQAPLDLAADAIQAQIGRRPSWVSEYGGAEMSVSARTLTIYWKASSTGAWSPPADLVKLVNRYDSERVRTRLSESRSSVAELEVAATAIRKADPLATAVALSGDSSGVIVETPSHTRAEAANRDLRSALERTMSETRAPGSVAGERSLLALSPYITGYEVTSAPVQAVAVRQNDSSAAPGWKGGARIRWPVGNGRYRLCSSGFSVKYSKFVYMVTAAHCTDGNNIKTQDGNGNTMGLTTNRTPGNDYMWIKVSRAAPRVYVGAWNIKSGAYRNVVGTVGNTKGSYTCQSGASTGANCDTKIVNENYLYKINGKWQWGVRAERQASIRAIGTGDSGGPVLKNTSRRSDIKAAGIISAGQVKVSCQGTAAPGTTCFKHVIYKRIQTARGNGTVVTR